VRKRIHARYVRLHLRSIWVTKRYVDASHVAKLFEDSLKDALARFQIVLVLVDLMARRKPLDQQIRQEYRVGSFARLHFVHVDGVAEKRRRSFRSLVSAAMKLKTKRRR
jgi:hypothetical protein